MIKIKAYASGSGGNIYIVSDNQTNILLECGMPKKKLQEYLRNENMLITDFRACLISHSHSDHCENLDYVLEYLEVYSTFELAQKNKKVIPMIPKQPFKIGTIKVLPISVEHGMCENNAFVFMDKDSCVFFGTDFSIMEQNVSNFKFNQVFIECNYDDKLLEQALNNTEDERRKKYLRQLSTHMSKYNCKLHLSKMDLSQCDLIVLLHASAFLISKTKTIEEFEKRFKIKTIFAKEC